MRSLFASIILRSKDRLSELRSLLGVCLSQQYQDFEIVIVDSSEQISDEDFNDTLSLPHPKIRVVRTPPRGCAAAANEGVRHARGEVFVFVDDDDIPVGDQWLAAHMKNYEDPNCLGVNGFMLYEGEEPPPLSPTASSWILSFGFWKNARWNAPLTTRKEGIGFLMGGNASLRRQAYERGQGWDEFLPYHNECSLFLRLQKTMRPEEYLVYDPEAKMRIRRDIPGGVGQRVDKDIERFVDTLARYYLWVVAPCHPERVYGLFPAFAYYFVSSTAKNAANFIADKVDGEAYRWSAYRKTLFYAPQSLWRHLRESP